MNSCFHFVLNAELREWDWFQPPRKDVKFNQLWSFPGTGSGSWRKLKKLFIWKCYLKIFLARKTRCLISEVSMMAWLKKAPNPHFERWRYWRPDSQVPPILLILQTKWYTYTYVCVCVYDIFLSSVSISICHKKVPQTLFLFFFESPRKMNIILPNCFQGSTED